MVSNSPGYWYWHKREDGDSSVGIAVIAAWMLSHKKHLRPYVSLYASLGWDSLVAHSCIFNQFSVSKSTSLAITVINEISKEIGRKPKPIVFVAFSGGPKSCLYKIYQILDAKSKESDTELEKYKRIRNCVAGQIYDSSPVDFVSETGVAFSTHPTTLKLNTVPRVFKWAAQATGWSLDQLFSTTIEQQRAEFWQTLYSYVYMGPILFLCSEDDVLSPYQTISNFASRLQVLGGCVRLVSWKSSPHVGHYKYHTEEYKDAVSLLLKQAIMFYVEGGVSKSKKILPSLTPNMPLCKL